MSVRLLCLRHGESENVVAGVSGALPNAELTERGRAQAASAALGLRSPWPTLGGRSPWSGTSRA